MGILVTMLMACRGSETEPLLDTGWFDDTGIYDPALCPHRIVQSKPSSGDSDWYWRSSPTFWADTTVSDRYSVQLLDSQGYLVSETLIWSDEGNTFTLDLPEPLKPSADYLIRWSDCAEQGEVSFRTSRLGTPLDEEVSALVGNTYNVDLVGADWVEPGAMGALMSLYFTTPVLMGVQWADDTTIDLLGAPGYEDTLGDLQQYIWSPTWDFPLADFSGSPYFLAQTDQVTFNYASVEIPVYQFSLEATFSADGSEMGGGVMSGLGDSRHMGALFDQPGDEMAVCNLAATLGVYCEACPDGKETCLYLKALDVDGSLLPNISLVEKN